jgi:hypothetical protein
MGLFDWITKVNHVDTIDADHINKLQTYKADKWEVPIVVTPEAYGAKRDDATFDNHDAIVAAIETGKDVILSPGVYYTSTITIVNKHGLHMRGSGALRVGMANYDSASVIRSISAQTYLMNIAGHEMVFEDLAFDGALITDNVIYMGQYSSLNRFDNCVVERATSVSGKLVYLDALDAGGNIQCDQSYWVRCIIAQDITITTPDETYASGADKAIYARGTNSNIHKFDRCLIGGARNLYHSYGGDASFFNCDLQAYWTAAFYMQGNASLRVQDCYTECDRTFLRMIDTLSFATPIILINNQLNNLDTNLYIIPKVPVVLIGNRFNADVNIAEVPVEADGKNVVAIGNSWATSCNYFAGEGATRWLTSIDNYDESGNLMNSRDEFQNPELPRSVHKVGSICWYSTPTSTGYPGWVCVSRTDTTVKTAIGVGDTVIDVADTTGILAGDMIGVVCDSANPRQIQWSYVINIVDGDTLEFQHAFIAGEVASVGNTVYTMRWEEMAPIGMWDGTNKILAVPIGTNATPASLPANRFQLYAEDIGSGNAAPHFMTENGTIIRLDQPIDTAASPSFAAVKVAGTQVVGARVVDARLANIPNSGDATTDGIIAALQALVLAHGLGSSS